MISTKCFIIFAAFHAVSGSNILFLNGIASPSHHLWNRVLIKGLAEKGHNITMVSVDDDQKPPQNVHYIYLEAAYKTIYSDSQSMNLLEMSEQQSTAAVFDTYDWCQLCCDGILKSKGLDTILNYPNDFKFDSVIYDFTCGPCLLPLIHKFNYPPLVSVSAFSNPPYTHHLNGAQIYPSYVPHFVTSYPQLMSFTQRVHNMYIYAVDAFLRQYVMLPNSEKKIRERFNFKDFPSLDVLEKKTAIVLVNSDNAIDSLEPLPPNTIQVGGLQISEPKQLPTEMLKFVESGHRGTVLMSLGTNIKSNMLGSERLTAILETFAQLPDYNFIWKFESERKDLPIQPSKNVFISNFLPQNDILAHPHVKAFVTHSGLLSTQETLWYGKPMVSIPFFCDQGRISSKMVMLGVGVMIDFRTLNVKEFKAAILKVLEDSSFSRNASRISKLFRDKPMKSLDIATWWIEYVMRNPSAPHYESPTLKLGPFVSQSYDILLAILVLIHIFAFVLFKLIKCIRNTFKAPSDRKKSKRN